MASPSAGPGVVRATSDEIPRRPCDLGSIGPDDLVGQTVLGVGPELPVGDRLRRPVSPSGAAMSIGVGTRPDQPVDGECGLQAPVACASRSAISTRPEAGQR